MKARLGVIGGMGPVASAIFIKNIAEKTCARTDQEHVDIVCLQNSKIPDRTAAILSGQTDAVLSELVTSAKELESLGCKNISIPCNTACFWAEDLQKHTKLPVINIVEQTAMHVHNIKNKANPRVGVLATDGTKTAKTYDTALSKFGMTCIYPDATLQALTMDIIYEQVKATGKGSIEDFNKLCATFKEQENLDYIILGCTELSWFTENFDLENHLIDALAVLVRTSIEASGHQYKSSGI